MYDAIWMQVTTALPSSQLGTLCWVSRAAGDLWNTPVLGLCYTEGHSVTEEHHC